MKPQAVALRELPGAELVITGLDDLERGRESVEADAVMMAAERLREAGLEVPSAPRDAPAAHRLYRRLARDDPRGAHGRYNAIVRRMTSFARAAERARAR